MIKTLPSLRKDWLRYLIAVVLLIMFIVPNRVVARFFLSGSMPPYTVTVPQWAYFLLAAICLIVISMYWKTATANNAIFALFIFSGIYLAVYSLTPVFWYQPDTASRNCFSVCLAILVGLLAARICGTSKKIAVILCLLATIQAILTIYNQSIGINEFISGTVARAGGTFNHPNGVYTVMILCIPLSIMLAMQDGESWELAVWIVCASLMFSALTLTWYRGGMLAIGVGLTWLTFRSARNKRIVIIVGILLTSVLLLAIHVRTHGTINELSSRRSIHGRFSLWQRGERIFATNWLTGVGAGALELPVSTKSIEHPGSTVYAVSVEPKNLFLHWMDELGISGGFLFILFLFAIVRVIRQSASPIAIGLSSTWICLFIAGMFDTPIGTSERYYGNALLGALLGATILLPVQQTTINENSTEHISAFVQ